MDYITPTNRSQQGIGQNRFPRPPLPTGAIPVVLFSLCLYGKGPKNGALRKILIQW